MVKAKKQVRKAPAAKPKPKIKKRAKLNRAAKKPKKTNNQKAAVSMARKDRVITTTSKKDIWRRAGTRRIKGGALDAIDAHVKAWIDKTVAVAIRSAVNGRRRTIKAKDVDFAFATEGTAVY